MQGRGRRLPGYASYIAFSNTDKKGEERQKVVRFAARWQLARAFDRIVVDGDRDRRTTLGYSALLRLALAFSVVDQFEAACGVDTLRRMRDRALADELRAVLEMHAVIGNERTSGMKSRGRFADIDTTDDIRVFAYALRNMFVHGSGTPWGVGANRKRALRALDRLSEVLLGEVEREFEAWAAIRVRAPQ